MPGVIQSCNESALFALALAICVRFAPGSIALFCPGGVSLGGHRNRHCRCLHLQRRGDLLVAPRMSGEFVAQAVVEVAPLICDRRLWQSATDMMSGWHPIDPRSTPPANDFFSGRHVSHFLQ
jgi:hypothetical protein